jgi:hypothetical protein
MARHCRMKEGYRFVGCGRETKEPADRFDKYLEMAFRPRIILFSIAASTA